MHTILIYTPPECYESGNKSTLKQIQQKFCQVWVAAIHLPLLWNPSSMTQVFPTSFSLTSTLGLMSKGKNTAFIDGKRQIVFT